ncbi:WD40 repeat domain-containing protein [Cryobacterium sp. BB736]|uniref:WD40 repeat domain-containing protein n=1 Tax=Cryobacterium sp. BB736 TaxID=2746963 RepID=UPI0018737005|nr:WD40 repeat domain-containing protein [Cryobacterium sp. BB736]
MTLFDGDTGEPIHPTVTGPVASALGPDGTVFGGSGTRIVRYDKELQPVNAISVARVGVASLQLSADGSVLLSSSADQTVSLFDAATGTRLGTSITVHAPLITPGFVRPDGMEAAVTGRHGVLLWDLNPNHLADYACTLAGRNLTAEEWRTHLAAIGERRETCEEFSD